MHWGFTNSIRPSTTPFRTFPPDVEIPASLLHNAKRRTTPVYDSLNVPVDGDAVISHSAAHGQ